MSATRVTSIVRWLLVAAVLCGAWVSGRLVASHDGGWRAGVDDAVSVVSPCGLRSLSSAECTEVVESRWGSFDFYVGQRRYLIPTSLIGFAYFVFLGVWMVLAPPGAAGSRWIDRGWRCVTGMGVAGSVFFLGVMGLALERWCPSCLIVHGLNTLVFVGVLCVTRRTEPATDVERSASSQNAVATPATGRLIGATCALSIGSVLGTWLYFDAVSDAKQEWRKAGAYRQAYESLRERPDLIMREFLAQPRLTLPEGEVALVNDAIRGPRVILFTDFDCPACACFQRAWLEELAPAAGRNLNVELRFLPRTRSVHQEGTDVVQSMRAALAAEAARMQGGASALARMTRLLFAYRRAVDGRDYEALARAAGLDADQFLADMNSPAARERIEKDMAFAREWGVDATPTVFVDGRRVPALCLNSKAFWATVAHSMNTNAPGERVSSAEETP